MNYFNKLFKNVSKPLLFLPLVFALISITMMFSTSYDDGIVFSRTVLVQSIAYVLGFIAIFVIIHMDYSNLALWSKYLYIFSVLFLFTPWIPGLGVEQFGARSWIDLGITTFQPSEIVKITFVILVANYFSVHDHELNNLKGFFKSVAYAAPIILIVLKEDFGSAAVFVGMWISMVLFAGVKRKMFAKVCGVGALCMPIAYKFLDTYQQQRITAFLYPDNLTINANYQVWHSKVAIGSGGFFGKGLFQGTQKDLDFLPVMNSDFIFAVICEELGFIGGAGLIALFGWFIYSTTKVAFDSKDKLGGLIVMGFTGMFLFQILENIAMTMGLMPVTGITLPFISYGGSSVISNMIAVGFIINVAINTRGVAFIKQ